MTYGRHGQYKNPHTLFELRKMLNKLRPDVEVRPTVQGGRSVHAVYDGDRQLAVHQSMREAMRRAVTKLKREAKR